MGPSCTSLLKNELHSSHFPFFLARAKANFFTFLDISGKEAKYRVQENAPDLVYLMCVGMLFSIASA